MKKSTERLVDRAARGPDHAWSSTKTLRGNEKRLLGLVRGRAKPSPNKDDFYNTARQSEDDLDHVLVPSSTGDAIPPGTFVELRRFDIFFSHVRGVQFVEQTGARR